MGELLLTKGVAVLEAIVELEDGKGIELDGRSVEVVAAVAFEGADELSAMRDTQ